MNRPSLCTPIRLGMACLILLIATVTPARSEDGYTPQVRPVAQKKFDWYLSLYVLGSHPLNSNVKVNGEEIPGTVIRGGIGAGIKAGIFPWFTKRIVGLELETFGHGGSLAAPQTSGGSGVRSADAKLAFVSTMWNVIARYPGTALEPYVGVGLGNSIGILSSANIRQGGSQITGSAAAITPAYQILAGVRSFVGSRVFLFGEYKYFGTVSDFQWDNETGPDPKLGIRAHIVAGGVGLSF